MPSDATTHEQRITTPEPAAHPRAHGATDASTRRPGTPAQPQPSAELSPRTIECRVDGLRDSGTADALMRQLARVGGVSARISYATGRGEFTLAADADLEALHRALDAYDVATELPRPAPSGHEAEPERAPRDAITSDLRRRIAFALPLTAVVLIFSYLPALRVDHWQWLSCGIAGFVVFGSGALLHTRALEGVSHRRIAPEMLTSAGLIAIYATSLVMLFVSSAGDPTFSAGPAATAVERGTQARLYFDAACIATVAALAIRLVERTSRLHALWQLLALRRVIPETATLVAGENYTPVSTAALRPDDEVAVQTGQRIPVDGLITGASTQIDATAVTGAQQPARVTRGDQVLAGSLLVGPDTTVLAGRTGEQTHAARLSRISEDAQLPTLGPATFSTRCVRLIPAIALFGGVIAAALWIALDAQPAHAIIAGASVWIVASPGSLTLAGPMAMLRSGADGAAAGVLFRSERVLRDCRRVDTVVIERYGTLGAASLEVVDTEPMPGYEAHEVLGMAAALYEPLREPAGTLAIATALETYAEANCPVQWEAENIRQHGTGGVSGTIAGKVMGCGDVDFISEHITELADLDAAAVRTAMMIPRRVVRDAESHGHTALCVSAGRHIIGLIVLAERDLETTNDTLHHLAALDIQPIVLTDEQRGAAEHFAKAHGIDSVIAECPPAMRDDRIAELVSSGRCVAYASDGSGGLTAPDGVTVAIQLGAAPGRGFRASDIVTQDPSMSSLGTVFTTAGHSMRRIEQYMFFAIAFHIVALPVAMSGWMSATVAGLAGMLPALLIARVGKAESRAQSAAGAVQTCHAKQARGRGRGRTGEDSAAPTIALPGGVDATEPMSATPRTEPDAAIGGLNGGPGAQNNAKPSARGRRGWGRRRDDHTAGQRDFAGDQQVGGGAVEPADTPKALPSTGVTGLGDTGETPTAASSGWFAVDDVLDRDDSGAAAFWADVDAQAAKRRGAKRAASRRPRGAVAAPKRLAQKPPAPKNMRPRGRS